MRASRHLRAVLAAATLAITAPARGDDLSVSPGVVAPKEGAPLIWKHGDLSTHGWWVSDLQMIKIDARIRYLEDKAARECVDAQIEAAKRLPKWWYIAGGIITGAALGYCAAASNHCGIGK